MAATLEELVVQLVADSSSLRAEMTTAVKSTENAMDKMAKAVEGFSKEGEKKTSFFQTAMATMAGFIGSSAVIGAFNKVMGAVHALGEELLQGVDDANKEEVAMAKLTNAMILAGNYSQSALTDLNEFASGLEYMSGVADDVVISNLAMLSSLTKLDSEGLKKAQQAAVDLAATINVDLDTATKMVAKAVDGNTDSFKRYGITLEESQNKTKALEIVTTSLINGMAAAKINTFAGQIQLLGVNMGNLFEGVAKSLTGNAVVMGILKEINSIIKELTTSVGGLTPQFKEFVANALISTIEVVKVLIDVFNFLRKIVIALQVVINGLVEGLIKAFTWLANIKDVADPFAGTKKSWAELDKAISGDDALGKVSSALERIKGAGENAFGKLKDDTQGVTDGLAEVNAYLNKTPKHTEQQLAHNKAVQDWAKSLMDARNELDSTYKFEDALVKNSFEMQKINVIDKLAVEKQYLTAKMEMQQAQFAAEREQLAAVKGTAFKDEESYNAAVVALTQQQTLQSVELKKEQMTNEKAIDEQRKSNLKDTLGTISSLQSSNSKELAAIGKAAAIYQATVDGYAAVQKALASAPPPFNFALAAAVGVATAANVSKIAGVGLAEGGVVMPRPGGIQATIGEGKQPEAVIPLDRAKDMGFGGGPKIEVHNYFTGIVGDPAAVGAMVIETINEARARGMGLGFV